MPIERFDELIKVAESHNLTVFDICFRVAGVGILWCDQEKYRLVGTRSYKDALVVYAYYPTLQKAIYGELERLMKLSGSTIL